METSIANQNLSSDEPVWVLLSEFSLRDFLLDHDRRTGPTAGSQFEMLQEVGMSPECMEMIAGMLVGFIKETLPRTKQGRLECPGWIRIYCQKKIIENANSTKSSRPPEQDEQKRLFPAAGVRKIGGWGYFMIERGEDLPPDSSAIPNNYIDLYLYKEGE